tara:strand:- start:5621 stop:6709 length:1089 start_codon:yes stop_codon:yes gene_type:complete
MSDISKKHYHLYLVGFLNILLDNGPTWLVKGLIPLHGFTVVFGPPKSGKSFWLFDLLMHVVLGWRYRGRTVAKGAVVYVVAEGIHGFRARKEAYRQEKLANSDEDLPFYILPAPIDLIADHQELIGLIKQELGDQVVVAVAFDTLARTLNGPENSNEVMGDYIEAMDTVRDAFNCAVIAVHHSGVEGGRPRGASSLTGAADAQLAVTKTRSGVITVKVDAMKDGVEDAILYSKLETVVVGKDADDDDITSCIVVEAHTSDASDDDGLRLMPQATKALGFLRELIDEEGEAPSDDSDLPDSVKIVRRIAWRDRCKAGGLADSADGEAFKKAWQRVRQALTNANLVRITDDGYVYLKQDDETID